MTDTKMDPSISATQPPLAVVGLSALFPKAANIEEFWSNIRRGVDAITEVPSSHWNPQDYFDENQKSPDMTYARRGGFLSPLPFDPLEFGISPNNLEAIDTSQLLGLVGAKRALDHAGYGSGRTFDRSRVGCILGVTGTLEMVIPLGARLGHPRWRQALKDAGVADDVAEDVVNRISQSYVPWQENSFPGLLGNVVAGRIANRLDLHGTNCVVDSACASSLSAIHLAALELWTGRSDMVVSGGIDTFNDIFMFMCFSKTPALSPTGDARPFSDEADGTILGEGVGIVVLKRLADAERDGDKIYAVLKGIGTSSDGAGNAVYAPKAEGQIRCLQDAYRVAGVSPDTVELVEAHGTGTKVGDATEVSGLMNVYQSTGRKQAWCAVGSIKSQIGHTKAAAGAAGIIKAIFALQHRVLPPTIKVNRPPAAILADDSPFYVNTEARPWLKPAGYPRRAAVSAFGFGGSNFHCVLEESPQKFDQPDWDGDVQVIALSASSVNELSESVRSKLAPLAAAEWSGVRSFASASRSQFKPQHSHRMLLVVERDKTDLAKQISGSLTMLERYPEKDSWSTPDGVYYGRGAQAGKLGVLFPGQGSQYVGMLRDLTCRFPVMNDVISEANEVYADSLGQETSRRLSDYIYPHPKFTAEDRSRDDSALRATQIAQPAIGAVSLAVLAMLDHFGVEPQAVAGHSYGELTALCASRRFAPRVLYRLSMLRGRLMAAAQDVEGGMLALGAPLTQVEAALKELSVDLVVANHNSPTQVVLSGRVPEIDRANALFASRNIRGKKLAVAAAFHSPMVATASRAFRPVLDEVEFAPSRMPVYANSTAMEYPSEPDAARDLLAAQLARPVNFVREIERMYSDGVKTFLEVGPGGVLTGLVNSILTGRDSRAIAIDSSQGKRGGLVDLAGALAQLSSLGYSVRWQQWDPQSDRPLDNGDPKRMRIPLCGANYVKPRSPIPPKPRPTTPTQTPIEIKAEKPAEVQSSLKQPTPEKAPEVPAIPRPVKDIATASAVPSLTMPNEDSRTMNSNRQPDPQPVPSATRAVDSNAQDLIRQTLAALQRMQMETTRLHQQFLEGQEAAFKTFERLAQQQISGIRSNTPPESNPSPAPSNVTQPESIRENVVEQKSTAPIAAVVKPARALPPSTVPQPGVLPAPISVTPDRTRIAPAAAPVQVPMPVKTTSQPAMPVVKTQSVIPVPAAPVPEKSPTIPSLGSTVLAVVSEKTGYPTEMLNLDMSLDHDLGIDSIKRVEILSALQERVPQLPAFQPDELGSLHTLRDVVNLADARTEKAPVAISPPATSPITPPAAIATPSAPKSPPVSVPVESPVSLLGPTVLQVVSETTGYPTEMLNLDMSLDHDLGIDSIKRVEILSALQERVSNLPAFQPDELGSLHTLRDVVALADARSSQSSPLVTSKTMESRTNVPEPSTSPKSVAPSESSGLATTVLEVVSEKTGYPTEMLNLDMSLDHDLGIDSIKRVEILSALQERVPNLPAFQPEELGALHTLRDVVTLADARTASSSPAPVRTGNRIDSAVPTVQERAIPATATPPQASLLSATVLEVVSEKTGYPTEMLNLDMSLDHDLGIDSIKRVEILSALQERMPNLPAFQPEELGSLHTLQDVVKLADARSNATPSTASSPPPVAIPVIHSPVQTPTTEASAARVTGELGSMVLEVVAEKTGYPVEMLNLEMSLDHDLGIDSIKRVEILSALQERVPNLPAFQPEELGTLNTLKDVVQLANSRIFSGTSKSVPKLEAETTVQTKEGSAGDPVTLPFVAAPTHRESAEVRRSLVRVSPLASAFNRKRTQLHPGSEVWITDDGSGFSQAIASELNGNGCQTRIISLDSSSPDQIPDRLAGLIIVTPQHGIVETQLWDAIRWLQTVGPKLRRNSPSNSTFFATISRLDGRFGFEAIHPLQDPVSGGLAGLAKCAAREWPEVISRAFDISPDWSANHVPASMLVAELLREGPVEVGITPNGSFELTPHEVSLKGQPSSRPISPGDVIVISGGARGVTAEAAYAIAMAWQPRLVILGRSPEPAPEPDWLARLTTEAEIKQGLIARAAAGTTPKAIASQLQQIIASREIAGQLDRLRSIGTSVRYFSVDVRNPASVQPVLTQIQREWGPVRGIIHGAGVLADQKIEDKTKEQFERVYQTKINGLNSLLACIDADELRLLGLFSSYTARFGRVGQTDYAIANEVLNKVACQFALQHLQCRVASFNWGPWDGGMVQGGLKDLFASEGVGLIPLEAGRDLLVREFEHPSNRSVEILVLAETPSPTTQSAAPPEADTNSNGSPFIIQLPSVVSMDSGLPVDLEKAGDLKVVLDLELDVARYQFLESHVLGSKGVLPVAVIMEWLAHAAIHRNPGLELRGIEGFRVFQGIRLGAKDRLAIKVLAGRSIRVGDQFTSHVQIVSQLNGREVLHAGANVVLSPRYSDVPQSSISLNGYRYPLSVSAAYSQRLFHGPLFHGITSIESCSEQGIVVMSRAAANPWAWMAEPVRGNWLTDPLVIDSALQAIILWSQELRGKPCLPCAVSRFQQFRRTFPKDGVRISVRIREAPEQLIRCDVEFLDQNQAVIARMEGCESVADSSLVAAFQRNRLDVSTH